jgi:hypothetical protein
MVFKTGKIVPVGFQNWQEWPCPVFKGGWGSAAGFLKENCLSEHIWWILKNHEIGPDGFSKAPKNLLSITSK